MFRLISRRRVLPATLTLYLVHKSRLWNPY
jgi:hypothetical protein